VILQADARAIPLADCSVHAIVTDPPYGLEFMGKEWDKLAVPKPGNLGGFADGNKPSFERVSSHLPSMQAWHETWAREALRVLKPGGHLLAFGGTRTHHRLMVALEDAGFEIRDCLMWLYGSGFPKSLDVSKAIDKAAGVEREKIGPRIRLGDTRAYGDRNRGMDFLIRSRDDNDSVTTASSDHAKEWQGWGTALKPAWEPIILARKPLAEKNVAANVLAHGTGALNVDGCRIAGTWTTWQIRDGKPLAPNQPAQSSVGWGNGYVAEQSPLGRWPANVVLSHSDGCELVGMKKVKGSRIESASNHDFEAFAGGGLGGPRPARGIGDADGLESVEDWRCVEECAVRLLDEQSGELKSGDRTGKRSQPKTKHTYGQFAMCDETPSVGDTGGASRFFYTAKASRSEREEGLGYMAPKLHGMSGGAVGAVGRGEEYGEGQGIGLNRTRRVRNTHPTVKPVALMRWLLRLVTPPGGLVLDPFAGSGSTLVAARLESINAVGFDLSAEYVAIAEARLAAVGLF